MFDIKQKIETLKKEYSQLNSVVIKATARMRGIEGALEVLEEQIKENSSEEKK